MTNIYTYPCDRGMPRSIPRWPHRFEANSAGVVCCIFCGARPPTN